MNTKIKINRSLSKSIYTGILEEQVREGNKVLLAGIG
jgi:hypothetical protein